MKNEIRIPSNDEKLEMAVLGLILMSKDALYSAMPRLFDELFYSDANRAVFTAIRQLYDTNSQIDIFTVYGQIKKNGDESRINGVVYLTKLEQNVTTATGIDTHLNLLAEHYIKRELAKNTQTVGAKCYENDSDAFDLINELSTAIEKTHDKVLNGKTKDIVHYVTEMLKQHSSVKETGVLGLKTGIEDIDRWMGGLVSPDLIIIAARPGQGKTALALSITHNLSVLGDVPGAWFSFEMDGVQLIRRLASMNSGIDHQRIKQGLTNETEDAKLHDACARIADKKIYIEDNPSMTIRELRAKALLLHKKYGIKYIVVDYLQLMSNSDKFASREQVVSEISRNLKIIAKELNIPVIALSQLNRGVENRADKMPNLSDLRESGAIEQDADEVLFIMRPEYYGMNEFEDKQANNLAVIGLDKNRHGQTGLLFTHFDGAKMFFSSYKHF